VAVDIITLKISIYSDNGRGKLLEVRTLPLNSTIANPGQPISFDKFLSIDHLPPGYGCAFQVIEAHYLTSANVATGTASLDEVVPD
jgi:hypothetical protein